MNEWTSEGSIRQRKNPKSPTSQSVFIMASSDATMEEVTPLSTATEKKTLTITSDKMYHDDPENSHSLSHSVDEHLTHTTIYTSNKDTFLYPFLPTAYLDKLYPTDVPRSVQLLRKENIAVPACYLCVGLLQGELTNRVDMGEIWKCPL